jgi:organic hydroperoxide reductase OsmC/OhrA
MTQAATAQPHIKRKTFHYETDVTWLIGRAGMLKSGEKPEFRVASPPEFQGEAGVWTPEDLFVGAVNACSMSTFLAYAQKKELSFLSYQSRAVGILEFSEGKYWFTRILLKPEIIVGSIEDAALAEKVLYEAHNACFLTNSVKSEVVLEPEIKVQEYLV